MDVIEIRIEKERKRDDEIGFNNVFSIAAD
jgi:hypothetical protein